MRGLWNSRWLSCGLLLSWGTIVANLKIPHEPCYPTQHPQDVGEDLPQIKLKAKLLLNSFLLMFR